MKTLIHKPCPIFRNTQFLENETFLKAHKSLLFPQFSILVKKFNFTQNVHLSIKSADILHIPLLP